MPASGEVLLDSSVIVPYLRKDAAVRQHILSCSTLYLPDTALGELYCGAFLSHDPAKTLAEINNFLSAVIPLHGGLATAQHYGKIRAALSRAGTPLPENDIWIAAFAAEHNLPLATKDAHFDKIDGIQVLKW